MTTRFSRKTTTAMIPKPRQRKGTPETHETTLTASSAGSPLHHQQVSPRLETLYRNGVEKIKRSRQSYSPVHYDADRESIASSRLEDMYWKGVRKMRAQKEEGLRRQNVEMRECTFRPRTNKRPSVIRIPTQHRHQSNTRTSRHFKVKPPPLPKEIVVEPLPKEIVVEPLPKEIVVEQLNELIHPWGQRDLYDKFDSLAARWVPRKSLEPEFDCARSIKSGGTEYGSI